MKFAIIAALIPTLSALHARAQEVTASSQWTAIAPGKFAALGESMRHINSPCRYEVEVTTIQLTLSGQDTCGVCPHTLAMAMNDGEFPTSADVIRAELAPLLEKPVGAVSADASVQSRMSYRMHYSPTLLLQEPVRPKSTPARLKTLTLDLVWFPAQRQLQLEHTNVSVLDYRPAVLFQPLPSSPEQWHAIRAEECKSPQERPGGGRTLTQIGIPGSNSKYRVEMLRDGTPLPTACWLTFEADRNNMIVGFYTYRTEFGQVVPAENICISRIGSQVTLTHYRLRKFQYAFRDSDIKMVIPHPAKIIDHRDGYARFQSSIDGWPEDIVKRITWEE